MKYSDKLRNKVIRNLFLVAVCQITLLFVLMSGNVYAQNDDGQAYVIGTKDLLSISFWQQPELDSEVRVRDDGMIMIPVIGEIKAAGSTTQELAKAIIQEMTFYNSPVSQATVQVIEFNSLSVVVTGQVLLPAPVFYERIPDLWNIILDVGGPTETADLSRVTIVRKNENKSDLIPVDLLSIIKSGDLSKAPIIQSGDLINVPTSNFDAAFNLTDKTKFEGRNVFYVLGNVNDPGPRPLESGLDVLDAIALAGGYDEEADLKNVRVIMKGPRLSNTVKINMKDYIENGSPPRYFIKAEDTIVVPAKSHKLDSFLTNLSTVVPLITATITLLLVLDARND
jgi:polysaccharide export outer membrane protein